MGDWQPIETAPKDGTRVLGVDKDGWIELVVWENRRGGRWVVDVVAIHPTHWMPLPKAPR